MCRPERFCTPGRLFFFLPNRQVFPQNTALSPRCPRSACVRRPPERGGWGIFYHFNPQKQTDCSDFFLNIYKFLDLLQLILKSGVVIDGKLLPTVKGVPQGEVVSPLLANIALNKLDRFLQEKAKHGREKDIVVRRREPNLRFARYADDWCVFLIRADKQYAETLKEEIREFLRDQCGLELSLEKTKVTHVRDGFEFLGFRLEQGIGQRGKLVPKIKIGQKAISNIRLRLNEVTRYRASQESIDTRVQNASAVIRGWANYFKIAHNFSAVAGKLDDLAHWAIVKAISLKNGKSTKKVHRKFYFKGCIGVSPNRTIARFSDTKMSLDFRKPVGYEPGKGVYLEEHKWEADLRCLDKRRPGQMDLKQAALVRDGHQCRNCGCLVVSETSHVDHIQPVHQFASFEQANTLDNVQTLCVYCHKQKTRSE